MSEHSWADWNEYVKKTREENKKRLEDFLKKSLGEKVRDFEYMGLTEDNTIISASESEKGADEKAALLGVSLSRVIYFDDFIKKKSAPDLCIGFNLQSGKVIHDRKYYEELLSEKIEPYHIPGTYFINKFLHGNK